MKKKVNMALIVFAFLVAALFAIVINSHAQDETIMEGDVCVAFIVDDSLLYGLNLRSLEDKELLAANTFDFTVDPIDGEVYLARSAVSSNGYLIEDWESNVLFESGNRFFGFDAYGGELIFTDAVSSVLGASDIRTYLFEDGELSLLESHSGWPAIGQLGTITHLDQTTWFNGVENPNIHGNYPMAFNPSGTKLLSVENFEHLWLYDAESDESRELLSQFGDAIFIVSADWLPEGNILLSTYDADTEVSALWEYDEAAMRLTPLYSQEDTTLSHAQVIPCDYGL